MRKPALLFALLLGSALAAQPLPQEPLDGPTRIFQDVLLENLVGRWKLTGEMRGGILLDQSVNVMWVLNHQFLLVGYRDTNPPAQGAVAYEAVAYIGYDNAGKRYVMHLMDVFGGRASETVGYGTRTGNSIQFVFEYPEGPFHTTFTWDPTEKTWKLLLEQRDRLGKWSVFAEKNLKRPYQM